MRSGLLFFFLIGAILPLFGYLVMLRWPNSWFKYVNFPVILSGTGLIPPATAFNYVPWSIVAFVFNYVIRRRHFSWWTKYNCAHTCSTSLRRTWLILFCVVDVLSAALDSGVAIAAILIFFCLQYPANGTIGADTIQTWWGNTVSFNNADGVGTPLKTLAPGEAFG